MWDIEGLYDKRSRRSKVLNKKGPRYVDSRRSGPLINLFDNHNQADNTVHEHNDRMIRDNNLDRSHGQCAECKQKVVTGCISCPGCMTLLRYEDAEVYRNPEDDWSKAPDPELLSTL